MTRPLPLLALLTLTAVVVAAPRPSSAAEEAGSCGQPAFVVVRGHAADAGARDDALAGLASAGGEGAASLMAPRPYRVLESGFATDRFVAAIHFTCVGQAEAALASPAYQRLRVAMDASRQRSVLLFASRRESAPEPGRYAECRGGSPAFLSVDGIATDAPRYLGYLKAMGQSGILPRHGATVELLRATPADVLRVVEGDLGPMEFFEILKFPCRRAITDFWYSDEYQRQLKPLRAGAGVVTVTAFPPFRAP